MKYLVLFLVLFVLGVIQAAPEAYTITVLSWLDPSIAPPSAEQFVNLQSEIAAALAMDDINNDPTILPNTTLAVDFSFHFGSPSIAISKMIEFSDAGITLLAGNPLSDICVLTGIAGNVYGIAQISATATTSTLSDKTVYPYFTRLVAASQEEALVVKDVLLYYSSISGRGWTDIAIISTTDEYGVTLATNLISEAGNQLNILTFQQFLPDATDLTVELTEIERSRARVIIAFIFTGWELLITKASSFGLTGDSYVWLVPDAIIGITFADNSTSVVAQESRGLLGVFTYLPTDSDPVTQAFVARWLSLDPTIYPGAGPAAAPIPFTFGIYDMFIATALAIDAVDKQGLLDSGERIPPEVWTEALRAVEFNGTTGAISIDENGDRFSSFALLNFIPETLTWETAGIWSPFDGYEPLPDVDVVWYSNSTEIPDLDIRPSITYWSCHDREKRTDPTGKEVDIETPDGSNIDAIDETYICDSFIDCRNLSDESESDCSSNYLAVFIIFGIIAGLLIFTAFLLVIFVCIFGICLKYRRIRVSSPHFLILMLLSMIVGYASTYAWFGKPHPVGCAFQPWLLALSSISMITALCAKTFRIWRIFRFPLKRTKITNIELFVLWVIVMIPLVLILVLWTIISTPTATMEERDGEDHYVCTTGGFTGVPGGIVFFFIVVAYGAIILLAGAFLSIVTRKVPSEFNESRLVAISIYNLGFLSVVIIPVFLTVQPFNPFLAWILRTIAILYAFTATMVLQFLPKVFGVVCIDRLRDQDVSNSVTSENLRTKDTHN